MTTQQRYLARDYATLATRLADAVEAVPDWDEPSTCAGWTRRDVLDHLVSTQRDLFQGRGFELPASTGVAEDPVRAWAEHVDAAGSLLEDPAVPALEYDGHFGRTTLGRTLADYYLFDLVVHRWDLLPSTRFTEAEMDLAEASADLFGDALRWDGVCGPAVEVTPGADRQTRLLGRLGRVA